MTSEKKVLWLFILLICFINHSRAQVDYYNPQNIYRFADYLFHQKDYERAASEFQRYGYLTTDALFTDSLLLKIGLCYQFADNYPKAIDYYQRITNKSDTSLLSDKAHFQIALVYFENERYDDSENYVLNYHSFIRSANIRLKMNQLQGMNYLYQRRWEKALGHFTSVKEKQVSANDSLTLALETFAKRGTELGYKSHALAGLFSAILPGSGKFYTRNYMDGLYSLIFISLLTWQSYDGFQDQGKNSVKGWIYGSLGTVFYLGNIYGSAVSAKIYNKWLEDQFLDNFNVQLKWEF